MKVAYLLLFLLLAPNVFADDGSWWIYPLQSPVTRASCTLVASDAALFQALSRAGAAGPMVTESFPKIFWNDSRALVAIVPPRRIGLPETALLERRKTDLLIHLLPSPDAYGGAVVVEIQGSASLPCNIDIADGPQAEATFQTMKTVSGGGKQDTDGWRGVQSPTRQYSGVIVVPPPPARVPPPPTSNMGALQQDRGYVPVSNEYSRPSASPQECVRICEVDNACKAVTFIPDQRICWIKNSIPSLVVAPGMVSSAKRTP